MGVVARSAVIGLAIGWVLVAALLAVIDLTNPNRSDISLFVSVLVWLTLGVPLGALPGLGIGTAVGFVRRSLRPAQPKPLHLPVPQQPYDMWSELVERCAESTRRVAAAVRTVPKSPAKDWLQRISEQLTRELDDVRGIAQLGRALGAVDRQHPVYQRLLKAAHDFKQFENEVGRVALQMFDHPELDEARTHLEVLERQLPQLST
jgi:hypothetical protein